MLPQTEDTRRIDGQTRPSNDAEGGKRSRKPWLAAGIVLVAVAYHLWVGRLVPYVSGARCSVWVLRRLRSVLEQAVSVVSPKQTAPAHEHILPGNVQPYITSPIYSRPHGYLKKWYFDIWSPRQAKDNCLLYVIETQRKSTSSTAAIDQ